MKITFDVAKKIFLNRGFVAIDGGQIFDGNKWREAVAVISKWLEQEPCEDCISRQAVLAYIDKMPSELTEDGRRTLEEYISDTLPSITSESKMGYWIFDDEYKEHGHCSECGYGSVDLVDGKPHRFCQSCGVKMIEPRESEDKE